MRPPRSTTSPRSPGVDAQRLGAVGVIHGAEHAVRAAADDGRVRAIVVLTGYRPVEPAETAYLTDPGVDVLYVTSTAHRVDVGGDAHPLRRIVEPAHAIRRVRRWGHRLPAVRARSWARTDDRRLVRRGAATMSPDVEVAIAAADGWPIGGLLSMPDPATSEVPGALLVPASRHERDAYTAVAAALAQRGVASLRIDIRGRGASRGEMSYAWMTPRQRQRVASMSSPRSSTSPRCLGSIRGGSPWAPSRTPPRTCSTPSPAVSGCAPSSCCRHGMSGAASKPSAGSTCRCSASCRRRTRRACANGRRLPRRRCAAQPAGGVRRSRTRHDDAVDSAVRASRRRTARSDDRRLARRPPRLTVPSRHPDRQPAAGSHVKLASRTRWQISTW